MHLLQDCFLPIFPFLSLRTAGTDCLLWCKPNRHLIQLLAASQPSLDTQGLLKGRLQCAAVFLFQLFLSCFQAVEMILATLFKGISSSLPAPLSFETQPPVLTDVYLCFSLMSGRPKEVSKPNLWCSCVKLKKALNKNQWRDKKWRNKYLSSIKLQSLEFQSRAREMAHQGTSKAQLVFTSPALGMQPLCFWLTVALDWGNFHCQRN